MRCLSIRRKQQGRRPGPDQIKTRFEEGPPLPPESCTSRHNQSSLSSNQQVPIKLSSSVFIRVPGSNDECSFKFVLGRTKRGQCCCELQFAAVPRCNNRKVTALEWTREHPPIQRSNPPLVVTWDHGSIFRLVIKPPGNVQLPVTGRGRPLSNPSRFSCPARTSRSEEEARRE